MLVNIANAQAEAGSEVSVLIINELYEQSLVNSLDKRVNLVFLNRKKGAITPWFIVRLNRILERSKPDVIHLHRSDLYHFVWGKKLKSKVCITLHALPKGLVRREGVMHIVWRKIKKRSVLYSNVVDMDRIPHVFTISEVVQKTLYDNYGVESTVVCNGIVTSCFVSRPKTMPKGQLRVVMVSRLEHDKKGQDLLIRAAAALQGTVTAETYVRFLGKQTQDYVAAHLTDYDLFVQPSRWEGFGLTVAEAMAAGVPVLVSEGQGPAEVTQGSRYGWVFANGDADDLQRQIVFIKENYGEAMTKADEAKDYVRNTYDVSVTARAYLQEYEKIVCGCPKS